MLVTSVPSAPFKICDLQCGRFLSISCLFPQHGVLSSLPPVGRMFSRFRVMRFQTSSLLKSTTPEIFPEKENSTPARYIHNHS